MCGTGACFLGSVTPPSEGGGAPASQKSWDFLPTGYINTNVSIYVPCLPTPKRFDLVWYMVTHIGQERVSRGPAALPPQGVGFQRPKKNLGPQPTPIRFDL